MHVVYMACHATAVEMQMIVIPNDGHTFLEHRSCPLWRAMAMCILSVKNLVIVNNTYD